ncbi:MAG TPA: hypothetical protein VFJ90_09615, partial [Candidatus Didemnitutus sp.]|nr:hypothetical protein [Candidatus Didemnitutus sp.]
MEGLLVLLVLYLVVVLLVLPIWTFIKIRGHDDLVEQLRRRVLLLEEETKTLRQSLRNVTATPAAAKPDESAAAPVPAPPIPAAPVVVERE